MNEEKEEIIQEENNSKSVVLEYARVIIVTLLVTFIVLQFIQISRVYGTSMENTYYEGNVVLIDKVFYKNGNPSHNDIIVVDYQTNTDDTLIIKRVIGVSGDRIEIKDNELYRNGKQLNEKYIKEAMINNEDMAIDVPEGKVFVMGDNRNVSLDSRRLGLFDFDDDVIGKVVFKVPFF